MYNYLITVSGASFAIINKKYAKKLAFADFIKYKRKFLYGNARSVSLVKIGQENGRLYKQTIQEFNK